MEMERGGGIDAGLTIEMVRVADLREYENNPRVNDNGVWALMNSIREFGFLVPIVIDGDGVIAAGHTRVKAARELGMEAVPCVRAAGLSPEQVKAFRLADNQLAGLSSWDNEKLIEELAELSAVDLSAFGFDVDAILQAGAAALDLDAGAREEKDSEGIECHCPKCGFIFRIQK